MLEKKSMLEKIKNIKNTLFNNESKEDDKFNNYLDLIHLQQDIWELERHIRKNKKFYSDTELDNLLRLLENLDNIVKLLIVNNDKEVCEDNKLNVKKLDNGKILISPKSIDN